MVLLMPNILLISAQTLHLNIIGTKDGLETLASLIFITPIFTTVFGFPVAIIETLREGSFYRFFNGKQIGRGTLLTVCISTAFQLQFIVEAFTVIIVILLILIHINALEKWVKISTTEL